MKSIVALYDSAAKVYGTPFVVQHTAQAVRSLRDEVNSKDSNSDVKNHPDDFTLFELGSFDEDSGALLPLERPASIARAKDLKDTV